MLDRWLACVAQLEDEIPAQQFKPWIKPLVYLGYDEIRHVLRLGVPNHFKLNWVKSQFESRIEAIARESIDERLSVRFEIHRADNGVPGDRRAAASPSAFAPPQRASVGHERWLQSGAADRRATARETVTHGATADNAAASGRLGAGTARAGDAAPDHRAGGASVDDRSIGAAPARGIAAPGAAHGGTGNDDPSVRTARTNASAAPKLLPNLASAAPFAVDPLAVDLFAPDPSAPDAQTRLRPELTFDSFVHGKANQIAWSAALQIVERPGTAYNPLFLYGGVGLGKTHLLHAVGNSILERSRRAKVRYIHAQDYFDEMVRGIQRKSIQDFKRKYQSLDLLLIDDIQFLGGKERTQEEFFYTFEALLSARKQLIITSDTYPKELSAFEDRLVSRFGSGLIVEIEPPELEMRVAILLKKAEQSREKLPEEVAFFIAKNLRSNVRELEGALLRVIAFARFHSLALNVDLAREALKDLLELSRPPISIESIQRTTAEFFKIKVGDMYSKRRPAHIARARQVAMYFAKELTQKSFPEIGEAFGGRDHTTVMHAVKRIVELRQHDQEWNRQLHVLEQTLRG